MEVNMRNDLVCKLAVVLQDVVLLELLRAGNGFAMLEDL